MKLALQHNNQAIHATRAAFIRGSEPKVWLEEINRWNIPVQQFDCYLVPVSHQSIQAVGLVVVFKTEAIAQQLNCTHPYGLLVNKLLVPTNASLFPEVSNDELQQRLLHDIQFFHPTIGLVGFKKEDKLNLANLFQVHPATDRLWHFAKEGIPLNPPFQKINMRKPKLDDVLQSFQDGIDQKPLDEIPENGGDDSSSKITDAITRTFLKGALAAGKKLDDALDNIGSGSTGGSNDEAGAFDSDYWDTGPGPLDRFNKWASDKLDELEKKRQKELNRLLDMFDENTDEALRYAIPLDSSFLGRGTSKPSSRLRRRSGNFNWRIGGSGGATDYWNIGDRYFELRKKYQSAAEQALLNRAFKKAAYIYAHLLTDFHSAANALEQGSFYRDAAIIYKERLKNIEGAAACYVRGGLLTDAIDLYLELDQNEKVGDLYTRLKQTEKARKYYQICVDRAIKKEDYIDAARLMLNKLKQQKRALALLLNGWTENKQSAQCLEKYFDVIAPYPQIEMSTQAQDVYKNMTAVNKKTNLLKVLDTLKNKYPAQLAETSKEIAYEIISEQYSVEGKTNNLFLLTHFLQTDRLIGSDCSRFVNNKKNAPTPTKLQSIQLKKNVIWFTAKVVQSQFLALGSKEGKLYLARGNWFGHIDYYEWDKDVSPFTTLDLVISSFSSNQVIIRSSSNFHIEKKVLPKTIHFIGEQIFIHAPRWIPKNALGININLMGRVSTLHFANDNVLVATHYNASGEIKKTFDCKIDQDILGAIQNVAYTDMYYKGRSFYMLANEFLITIDYQGNAYTKVIQGNPKKMILGENDQSTQIAILLERGFALLLHEEIYTFATELHAIDIAFIGQNYLVVTEAYKALVFDLVDLPHEPIKEFNFTSPVKQILPTSNRHHCAFLNEDGRLNILDIRK